MEETKKYTLVIDGKRTESVIYVFKPGEKTTIEEYYRKTTTDGMRPIKGYIETNTIDGRVIERAIFPKNEVTPTEIELVTIPDYQAELAKVKKILSSTEEALKSERIEIGKLERQLSAKK